MDRFFYSYSDVLHSKIWKKSIDYIGVDQRLGYLKEQSVAFIQNNI